MNRRSFIQSILAAGVAPWVVTSAGVLMPGKGIACVQNITLGDLEKVTHFLKNFHYEYYGESADVRLPACDIGKQYIIKNEGKGTLTIYPSPVVMNPGKVLLFAQ